MIAINERIIREWNNALLTKRVHKDDIKTDVMKEISLHTYYAGYAAAGKNLFNITPTLGEMLLKTSAAEVPISAIKSPYSDYYIHFHKTFLWGTTALEGAYIVDDPEIPFLQVCVVVKPSITESHWMASPAPYLFIPISREVDAPLGELVSKAIDAEIISKWESVEKAISAIGFDFNDVRQSRAKRESMDLSSARDSLENVLSYIANCLCYLTSQPSEEKRYPDSAPASMVEKVINASTLKNKNRAKSKLNAQGYHPIVYVGSHVQLLQNEHDGESKGGSVTTHWRRGHWRQQRHGEGAIEVKLIWIKPTLVAGEKNDDEVEMRGDREYRVKN